MGCKADAIVAAMAEPLSRHPAASAIQPTGVVGGVAAAVLTAARWRGLSGSPTQSRTSASNS